MLETGEIVREATAEVLWNDRDVYTWDCDSG
jgi:hypothetical protein